MENFKIDLDRIKDTANKSPLPAARPKDRIFYEIPNPQQITAQCETIKAELNAGILEGRDPITLLLQAINGIAELSEDPHFYTQAELRIRDIYGTGLQLPELMKSEEQNIVKRLQQLNEAAQGQPSNKNIAAAIKKHEKQLAELKKVL